MVAVEKGEFSEAEQSILDALKAGEETPLPTLLKVAQKTQPENLVTEAYLALLRRGVIASNMKGTVRRVAEYR